MPPPLRSNPYRSTPDASADPRQIEGWALMEVAVRMKAAQRDPVDPEAVLDAVRLNRRLWTIIQASINREIAGGLLTLPAGGAQPAAAAAGSAPRRAPAPPPPLPGGGAPRKLTDMSA